METEVPAWLQYVKDAGPTIVGIVGLVLAFCLNKKILNDRKRDEERKEIYKKLNDFYSPFEQLRRKSKRLYLLFTEGRPEGFRTLDALLQEEKFSGNDGALLKEIITINNKLETLIIEKSGFVDQVEMRDLFAKAATHFHIIAQAHEGHLRGDTERFKEYVFPIQLDEKVSEQVDLLKLRLQQLYK